MTLRSIGCARFAPRERSTGCSSRCTGGGELIDLAARHRLTGALYESLRPTARGRLTQWDRDGDRTYLRALDHLGHPAADPLDRDGSAESVRDQLVDLARFGTTAADAAVRLPIHLVGEEQAELLLDHYEQRRTFHRELVDGTGPVPASSPIGSRW